MGYNRMGFALLTCNIPSNYGKVPFCFLNKSYFGDDYVSNVSFSILSIKSFYKYKPPFICTLTNDFVRIFFRGLFYIIFHLFNALF